MRNIFLFLTAGVCAFYFGYGSNLARLQHKWPAAFVCASLSVGLGVIALLYFVAIVQREEVKEVGE